MSGFQASERAANERRWCYLPGLGTGWRSAKAQALAERLAAQGVVLHTVDLRVPSFNTMQLNAMLAAAQDALFGATSAVVFGTSLGGYIAALLAATDPRIDALVLYAPALHLGRIRESHPVTMWLWKQLGWLPVQDKTQRRLRTVGLPLREELRRLDRDPPSVRIPTLIFHGRDDWLVRPSVSRDFARGSENVRLVEVHGGHDLASSWLYVLAETERFLSPWFREASESRLASAMWSSRAPGTL